MSNDRDIEDILSSLNQLLREGESRNDDHSAGQGPKAAGKSTGSKIEEKTESEAKAPANLSATQSPRMFDKEKGVEEASKPKAQRRDDSAERGPAEHKGPPVRENAPDAEPTPDEESQVGRRFEPLSVTRVVLTEDMMVDNPQGSLLSLIRNPAGHGSAGHQGDVGLQEADGESASGGKRSDGDSSDSDHDPMAELIVRISDELIERLRRELPPMIAESLYRHLKELKRDE